MSPVQMAFGASQPRPAAKTAAYLHRRLLRGVALCFAVSQGCAAQGSADTAETGPIRPLDLRFSEEVDVSAQGLVGSVGTAVDAVPEEAEDSARVRGYRADFKVSVLADDNIRRRRRGRGDIALLFAPTLSLQTGYGRHRLDLSYSGDYASYSDFNAENYIDHEVNADATFDFTRRFKGGLEAAYASKHQGRDELSGRQLGDAAPDRFFTRKLAAEATYGRRIAKAQVITRLAHESTRYQNNGQQGRDVDRFKGGIVGYYNFTPRFSAVLDLSHEYLDYRVNSPLDGSRTEALLGVRWEATEKTSGELKVGKEKRAFKDRSQGGGGLDNAWDISVVWEPRTYSKVRLSTSQRTQESAQGLNGTAVNRVYAVSWSHAFDEHWTLQNEAQYNRVKLGGRREEQAEVSAALSYRFHRNLAVSARFRRTVVGSTDPASEYENNSILLELNASYADR